MGLLRLLFAPRGLFAATGIAAAGLVCGGLILAHTLNLAACPLCILQRIFWASDFNQLSYKAFIPETNALIAGVIDEHGRTGKINTSDPTKVQVLVGSDGEWGLRVESFDEDDFSIDKNVNRLPS